MNRREAISRVAILVGATVIGGDLFLTGCKNSTTGSTKFALNEGQITLLDEVGETILPQTAASGGAKSARVGQFMQTMVRDCYSPADQEIFLSGIEKLNAFSKKNTSKEFLACSPTGRHDLLVKLDAEAKEYKKQNDLLKQQELEKEKASQAGGKPNYIKKEVPDHYFAMIKQLTLLGYFTSETGYKAQSYVSVPGHYDGNVREKQTSVA
jgi:hypothetical protein